MAVELVCPDCGSKQSGNDLAGLCPQCLLRLGLGAGLSVGSAGEFDRVVDPSSGLFRENDHSVPEGVVDSQGSGVLMTLDRSIGPVPHVLLRDDPADSPYLRRRSPEMPNPGGHRERYQLVGEVARGGMGAVLQGRDVDLGRDLAIKVILEKHRETPEMIRRFIEEAQIGGQLQHPGIVPVHELGRFPDGRLYIAMKLVRGRTLAALLEDRKSPSDDHQRFLAIFEQVCQTMAYAHSRGVVHRDLKPSNVMVGSFGEVQVMDWGLAKVLDQEGVNCEPKARNGRDDASAVRTVRTGVEAEESLAGSVLGTPAYMSPEQARGAIDTIDERADVFALGSILCEILSGAPAFAGRTDAERHQMAERADLRDTFSRLDSSDADADLIALAKSCLAPAPKDRPRDAGMVLAGLIAYVAGAERRLREAGLAKARAETVAAEERKRRFLAVALAASVLATGLLFAGGWVWMNYERSRRIEFASKEVGRALDYAERKREQAHLSAGGDRSLWVQAVEAARRAQSLLSQGEEVSPDLQHRVQFILSLIEHERDLAESSEKDRRMVERLAEIHNDLGVHGDVERSEAEYAAAFRAYGVDVDAGDPAKAGAKLAASRVAAELASALDQWVFLRRLSAREDVAGAQRLVAVAKAADPDPWRTRLRDTLGRTSPDRARARDELERLAATADVDRLPEASVTRLASALSSLGRGSIAVSLLRRAQRLHPDDFWVNADLGRELLTSGRPEEAVRFYAVAVGIRPRSVLALGFLGRALQQSGQLGESAETFRRMVVIRPDDAQARVQLGAVLLLLGAAFDADVELNEARRLKPADWKIRNLIAAARADAGEWSAAVEDCREAVKLGPSAPSTHNALGLVLLGAGRSDEAVDAFREAVRLDPRFSPAYVGLAHALLARGDIAEARETVARSGVIHRRDRSLEAASVAAKAERMLALDARLPALLRGHDRPADARETAEFAQLCSFKKLYAESARLWSESFTAEPALADAPGLGNRFEAARAAALVSYGHGGGGNPPLDPATRTRWRAQALDWMNAELVAIAGELKGKPARNRGEILKRLGRWRVDPDLAGLRDDTPLSTLPRAQRQAFRKFWSDLEALWQQVSGPVTGGHRDRA
jgi:serine/threonine-protein kinase